MGTLASGSIDLKSLNVAGEANKYITHINDGGITVHDAVNQNLNYVQIDANGMEIFKSDEANVPSAISIANFGENIRIGRSGQSRVEIDYRSMQLIDKEGNTYFNVNDLRDLSGKAKISESFVILEDPNNPGTILDTWYVLKYLQSNIDVYEVTLNDVATSNYECQQYSTGWCVRLTSTTGVSVGDKMTVYYYTTGEELKSLTFGSRKTVYSSAPGLMSVAMGENVIADGACSYAAGYETAAYGIYAHAEGEEVVAGGASSHAEGRSTFSSGVYSHAEGLFSMAAGDSSHAEGSYGHANGGDSHVEGSFCIADGLSAHAEGYETKAQGQMAHAEGKETQAKARHTHAQNEGTIASSSAQTAMGRYNIEDANDMYALIIGNGESDIITGETTRSNALTVDWDGNVDASGTVLGKLKRVGAITGEAPSDVTIATGTAWKELCNFTLTKGVWMVSIAAQFPANATGARAISLGASTAVAGGIVRTMRTPAASGSVTTLALSFPVEVSATSQTFYLNGYQSSGSSLTVSPRYTAVQIGNSTST